MLGSTVSAPSPAYQGTVSAVVPQQTEASFIAVFLGLMNERELVLYKSSKNGKMLTLEFPLP